MTNRPQSNERRQLRRFPAAEIDAQLKPRRGLMVQWLPVRAFDFTRAGLSIATTEQLTAGDVILLRLRLKLEMGELFADRLVAVVRNVYPEKDGAQRYGVEFDFAANRHMKSLETGACLGRMEGILDRSEKLRNRLMSQDELIQNLGG